MEENPIFPWNIYIYKVCNVLFNSVNPGICSFNVSTFLSNLFGFLYEDSHVNLTNQK